MKTTAYVVVTHHYTEKDIPQVLDGKTTSNFQDGETRTFTGPFPSEDAAVEWMDAQPDDEDVLEMYALTMNAP